MKLKQILFVVIISSASAIGSVALYNKLSSDKETVVVGEAKDKLPVNYAKFFEGITNNTAEPIDFTKAANAAVPAVVHIKTKTPAKKVTNDLSNRRNNMDDFFDQFFGPGFGPNMIPEQKASGSGVLISEDGYIVTNNHVISSERGGGLAEEINVTLHDRRTYKAKVIGRDPSSDIAVLKIDATKLPYLVYGNSDNIQLGQWVLAVGYPLTLETTVTAGIVSATGRSIGINSRQIRGSDAPIESFIQTDAAVNQGNSGGALINTAGQLIGVNSAILAPTGTYAGYSFAIPVNIVRKIVNDIIQFGSVQRGYLGVTYYSADDLSEEQMKGLGIPTNISGVYISSVANDGGAASAGIKKGDVITKVNGVQVYSGIQMSAQIASFRPGDKVPVTYLRNGKEYTTTITLKKKSDVLTANAAVRLGGELATLDKTRATRYGINGGVIVNRVNDGGILKTARVQPGFIITSVIVNGEEEGVDSVEDLNTLLQNVSGTIRVRGVYPDYGEAYTYSLKLDQ